MIAPAGPAAAPAPSPKPVYTHVVVERAVPATRDDVWPHIVEWAASHGFDGDGELAPGAIRRVPFGGGEVVEEILSVEPPWRIAYEITAGAPVRLFQGFVHVVPDPVGCRLIRSFLVDPLPGGASDEFVAQARATLEAWADRLAAAAAGAPPSPTP